MTSGIFGDLGTIYDGPHATPKRRVSGAYFLNIASLSGGRLNLSASDHVDADDFEKWTRRVRPQADDLLFSYETRLGEAALMPPGVDACLGRRMALLRPNRAVVDPQFLLYYYLSPSFQATIRSRSVHGATVSRLPLNQMASWPVRIPNLPTQRAIATVLTALDGKISANSVVAATAEQLGAAHGATARSVCALSDVAILDRRTVMPEALGNDRVIHYSIPAFDDGQRPTVQPVDDVKSSKFLVHGPRVLVSKLNPRFPRVWCVDDTTGLPGLASTEFLPLRTESVPYRVMKAVLSRAEFGTQLESRVAGTSGSHQRVRPDDLMSVRIPDPRALAPEVIDLIDGLVALAGQVRRESSTLAELRDTLLPALMSGRLRVKDAERQVEEAV